MRQRRHWNPRLALGPFMLMCLCGGPGIGREEVLYPRPPSLQAHVNFWKQVYAEYGIGDFVLHDRDKVGLV